MKFFHGPVFLVAILALGACAEKPPTIGGATPSSTATASASAAPSATPTAPPSPTVPPALSELVISPDGLGSVQIGQSFEDTSAASPLRWVQPFCAYEGAADVGGWKANYADTPFWVAFDEQKPGTPITYIAISSDELKTAEGFGSGSSTKAVLAEYGSRLTLIPDEYYPGYALRGLHGQVNFWVNAPAPDTIGWVTITEITDVTSVPWEGQCE